MTRICPHVWTAMPTTWDLFGYVNPQIVAHDPSVKNLSYFSELDNKKKAKTTNHIYKDLRGSLLRPTSIEFKRGFTISWGIIQEASCI